jgi:hypothetical protein
LDPAPLGQPVTQPMQRLLHESAGPAGVVVKGRAFAQRDPRLIESPNARNVPAER